jgi:hypothetical protein
MTIRESIARARAKQQRAMSPQQASKQQRAQAGQHLALSPQQLDLIRRARTTRARAHANIDAVANAAVARIQQLSRSTKS